MDRYSQDDLKNSSHKVPDPPSNGATSAVSGITISPKANQTIANNIIGDPLYGESISQYPATSQVNHHLDYKQPALQIPDTRQELTGKPYGQAYEDTQGEIIIPPLNLKRKTEADPEESHPEGFIPLEYAARPEPILSPLTHPNGISMFPELSALEQEELSREALDQAEESIVADSADSTNGGNDDNASDAGYDSDSVSSASTSAMSSVRDYMFENGRRYHRFREGSYNFPNDDVEQEREDMKHAMVKLLCSQKLHFAPIGDNPQEILDIGTGTGIWTIESK